MYVYMYICVSIQQINGAKREFVQLLLVLQSSVEFYQVLSLKLTHFLFTVTLLGQVGRVDSLNATIVGKKVETQTIQVLVHSHMTDECQS